MSVIEDEEHIREFLKKHTFQYDCSERKLMFNRYFRLRDYDKFEPERRYQFFTAVSTLLDRRCSIGWSDDRDSLAAINDFGRSLLALVRSGSSDTEPNMWVNERIEFGIERAKLLVL